MQFYNQRLATRFLKPRTLSDMIQCLPCTFTVRSGAWVRKKKQNKRESVNQGHKVLITETESNLALEVNSCMLYQFLSISPVLKLP